METVNEFLDKLASQGVKLSVEEGLLNCYAPKGALTPAIRDGIAKYRTEIIGLLEGRKRRPAAEDDGRTGGSVKEFPLSAGQKGLYILQKLYPAMSAYNVPVCFRIKSGLDEALLAKAWDFVLEQYPILTARVIDRDGALYQRLDDACRTTIQHQRIEFTDDGRLLALLKERAKQPFDLDQGPLTRVELFNWGSPESVLLLTIHHMVIDGMSGMIVLRSFLEYYQKLSEGKPIRLSRDLPGYQEFVAWEEAMLASPEGEAHASYWRKQLKGELPIVELAPDRPDAVSATFEGKTLAEQFPEELSRWVREYSKAQSVPASVIFLALFQLLLHRYTDQEDIIVGMPVMGRAGQKFFGDVGYFINVVPLRTYCDPALKLSEFFRRVQATMLDALFHSSYPFPLMLESLQIKEVRKDPVFQVTYAYQNFITQDTFAPLMQRQTLDIVSIPELTQEGEFDLGLEVFEEGPVFSMMLKYNPELYTDQAIRRLFESYCALLKGVSENSDRTLHEYPIISESEKKLVLAGFNDTRADYRTDQCLHDLFADSMARHKERVAVVAGDEQLTCEQLDARSNALALYLQSEGIGPDRLVGVYMERSLEMVVALVAILRAGGAYVPLDPDYPDERLAYMLGDSRPPIVLTQERLRERVEALMRPETKVVALDGQWPAIEECVEALTAKGVALKHEVQPHHLAYVIYTSGSTGQPKGVMNEHRGIVNRLIWMQEAYGLGTDDAVLQKTPFSFDVSVWEFFWPLYAGARLVMARPEGHKDPDYLIETIDRYGITTLHFVPSMLQIFLEHVGPSKCGSVRRVICSGEALPSIAVQRFAERMPLAGLHNLYGPTEAAVDVTAWACPAENIPTLIPIGRPIANTQIYILDRYGSPVPVGVGGELHIGGVQVARGYLNRPELTAERFVRDPFSPVAGARMYKTGDLARWRSDGTVEYLGRNDFQVKIRGFRIELGEIEARLMEHEGVQEAVVLAREDTPGDKRLVAYFTPSTEQAAPVGRFLRIRKTDEGATAKYHTLPNGLLVFDQNQSETEFLYDEIFNEDVYLKHGLTLNDGDCIFDVGANIGMFSLFVTQRCRNATIYAFEPIPKVFASLQLNAALHGWGGRVYQCGLADTSRQQVFTFYPHNTVISSSMTSREEAREIVKSYMLKQQESSGQAGDQALADTDNVLEARLDTEEYACELRPISDIIRENAIERIDLLKIDVEKAELDVLKGIQAEDWPKIRQLVIEVHDVSGRLAEIVGMLEALGYAVSHEQSRSLQLTDLYDVYAVRRSDTRGSAGEIPATKPDVAPQVWTSAEVLIRDVRAFLGERLPEYMVPSAFVPLDEMPLTPNGKLDRKALPAPEAGAFALRAYEPPQGEIEVALAAIWSEVLKIERVGRHDDFFELGGHSLLATQLVSRIHSQLGVDIPLKSVFDQTRITEQAASIAKAEQSKIPPILPVDRSQFERLPLSFAEERVWFVTRLVPEAAPVYSVPGAFVVHGELNLEHMNEAYNLIIARHETLRTIFPIDDGLTHRVILDHLDFQFQYTDLSQCAEDERDSKAKEICLADARAPFDLTVGPLIRGNVIKLNEQEHIVMVNMHHVISDGWSIGVLVKEFRTIMDALREGRRPELPPLPIQYVDYAIWQRQLLEEGGLLEKQLGYWRKKLAGLPESLDLTTDYPRPVVLGFKGATRSFTMDAQLVADLKRLGERRGATLYMVLLAAFKALLYRYTGQSDLCLGGLIANRNYGATEDLIGMFVNSLALRSQVEGDDTFVTLLSKVRATCLDAYENQDAPFPSVVEAMQLPRNTSISPLFHILFFLQSAGMGGLDHRTQRYFLDTGFAKYDLSVELVETPEGLDGTFEFNTELFRPQTIARLIEHFATVCRVVAGNPATRIWDLDYLGKAEKHQVLLDFNAARAEYPKDKCLHELFVEQVARHSNDCAIVCGGERLTYQQLYERSRDLALYLQSQGVGPDSLVGLCMDRSPEMVVGLLGILQAGGAYVPLDSNYPDERLAYMVRDSQAAIVLTQESLRERLRGLVMPETRLLSLDGQRTEIGERVAALKATGTSLRRDVRPHHLAYLIYTSGSTGQPKGVAIEHHSPVTLVHWALDVYSREELAGVLAPTSICFDLSIFEMFTPLASGGTIILVPNALGLLDVPNRESVTLINTVPSAMEELLRLGAIPDSVLTVNLAGEPLSSRLVDKIYDATAAGKVYDLYGPSEATTYSTYALRTKNGPQTIGRPIVNTQVYILDEHHQVQPIGVPGELYIAGDGLARGYLNRPELTQERFVDNPFEPGTRMYKTGDRGRWLDDGTIQYLGRMDTQVKVRGFRIELGEIEARLNQDVGILDCAVVAQGKGAEKRLIAFYRAEGSTAEHIVQLPTEELRAHLLQVLPAYMVPTAFVSLAAIPLSSNGKVDRRALEQMDVKLASGREYVAPRNSTEKQLVEIWAEVLKLAPEDVGIYDSFFELGGHSLSAVQLISRIDDRFKRSLPLLAIFTTKNVAELAVVVEEAERSEIPPILPVDRTQFERLPLSFAEERVWFISQLAAEAATLYSVPGAIVIRGELDFDMVDKALNLIIERHESLRTVFPSVDGQARRVILDHLDFRIERMDVSHYETREAREEKAKEICQADAARPFDLASGPLIRGIVIKLAEDEHVLMLNMHHIISDGWSAGVLIRELDVITDAFNQGRQPDLPPLPIQYVDYSVWQRQWLGAGGVLARQLAYWQEKLAGVPESLNLPTDRPRPSVQDVAGASHEFALDAQLTGQLKHLAEQEGGTLFMVLLAAFNVLLHRYTGQNDICVGTPIANRQYGETEGLIGMFVNTLALRTRIEEDEPFATLLAKVKDTCLEAYEHQDAPFEKVLDSLHLQRNLAITPLFQVMLILQNTDLQLPDERITQFPLDSGVSKFDITLEFTETPAGLAGSVRYGTALYEAHTIERMVRQFTALCQAITARPDASVGALEYLDAAEKRRLLTDFNDTRVDTPNDKCLQELFAEQVAIRPDQPAVVFGEQELTYQQLYQKSCDLASYLRFQGVGPDSLVGLYTERSLDMVVGMFGILQAGGAYVPLDPDYPAERLQFMLDDAAPAIVLTQERLKERLPKTSARTLALDSEWAAVEEHARTNPNASPANTTPDNLAYVIYTSGSTGVPKGVMVRHGGVANLRTALERAIYAGHADWTRVSVNASFSFDSSVKQFVQLLSGRTLILVPQDVRLDADALLRFISQHRVDVFDCTPSQLVALIGEGMFDGARRIPKACLIGGEAIDANLWRSLSERSDVAFFNVYGPAECTVDATVARITAEDPIPNIGRPVANVQIYILDSHGQPVPTGVVGEICIGGAGVGRGYWNRPELTAERFVSNPFSEDSHARLYKTGDLGRWRADGTIAYVGRNDQQVKLRGQRIELGEIEAQLAGHPGVKEAVVIAREDEPGEKRLVAYVTMAGEPVGAEELRSHLLARLPQYMVPAAFVELKELPLTPNKKVDRKGLPKPEADAFARKEYEPPQGETETALAAIWQELLHVERVGRNDDFFELGGHSLSAVQLISRINKRFQRSLPLLVIFTSPNIAELAGVIEKADRGELPPIQPIDRTQFERLPLSFAEERVWFMSQLVADAATLYSVPGAIVIRRKLDLDQVDEAFNMIIARHESLRTVFPSQDGQAQRRILDRLDFRLERLDVSHYGTRQAREERAREICQADATTPFDLARGPLIRGKVIRLAEDEYIVMLNMHHIINDGWSLGVLIKELDVILDAFRHGRRPELAPLPIQYADYSVWQRRWLEESGALDRQLAYWQKKLAGVPERLDVATDYSRPGVQRFVGATQAFTLDAQLTGRLKHLALQHGGTLYMVLLAAFKALLHRYTGQDDICVGSPIANRQYAETEGLIGMFVNTLALRSRVSGDDTFAGLLSKVKETCLEAYENQNAPFEKVVDMLRLQRDLASSPLFQVMLILQNAEMGVSDPFIQQYPLESGVSKFDLTIDFTETSEGLAGSIEYSTALYKPQTVTRMIDHFRALCEALTADPNAKIRDLNYLREPEQRKLLNTFNAARVDYSKDRCLHELFAEQVPNHPDAPAVVCGGEQLTYRQLHERSRDLALYLQSLGVGPDSLVGLCMDRSLDMVVGLLGILQAGGAYVPLDPNYPSERLAYMVRDSQAAIVLTQETQLEKLRGLLRPETRLLSLDGQRTEIAERVAALKAKGARLDRDVKPHHLAYVIYTSGSTGQPKGVAIEHHSPVTLVQWALDVYSREELAGVLAATSVCFDLSIFEMFVPLASGGTVILVPNALGLLDLPNPKSVTLINTVPSAMEELVRLEAIPDSVLTVNLAGEPLSTRLVDTIYDTTSARKVYDLYGPSEATTYSTYVRRTKNGPQTIGRPIANTQIYILDEHHQIQPIGVPGELYIAGDGVARGYLNRSELTRERFIANPFEPGTRMYKTGDRGRWLDDGTIQYLGRMDTQVKVRGFRIELGEIEARLNQDVGILDCAVVAQGEGAEKRLIAFYRAEGSTADHIVQLSAEELRVHLLKVLPDYMVPAAFVSLAAIPLSANGKVDRRALEKMDVQLASGREYVAPRNPTEEQLVEIWAEVLNLAPEKVGVNDVFFELGGHSLSAVQLISRINKRFMRSLPLLVVFTSPSIAAFAKLLSGEEGHSFEILVPLQTGGDAPPIFGIPGAGATVLSLQPLSRALGAAQPFYGLQVVGIDGSTSPLESVEQTAQANIAALKKVQARGPYSLIGHSYGGVVAYEMARMLLEEGEEVASLTLLDSIAPWVVQERYEATLLGEAAQAATNFAEADLKLHLERLAVLLNDVVQEVDPQQFAAVQEVYRANMSCYLSYKPAMLPKAVDVSLYRARQESSHASTLPDDYGWNRLLQTPLRIHDVDGDHYTMLKKVQFTEVGSPSLQFAG